MNGLPFSFKSNGLIRIGPENQKELSCQLFPAMLADICPYLDDLGAVRAFHRKVFLVYLRDRFVDFFLYHLMAELIICYRFDCPQFAEFPEVFRCLKPYTAEAVLVDKHTDDRIHVLG